MLYKKSFVWLRLFRRKTYLWLLLGVASIRVIYLGGTEQQREKARWMVALAKLDFVKIYGFMNDLLW